MPGVTVRLYDVNTGTLVGTQFTDANGNYLFTNILEGNYYLEFDITPVTAYDGYVATIQDVMGDTTDSDILTNWRTTPFFFYPPSGDDLTRDAGFHLECKPTEVVIFGN